MLKSAHIYIQEETKKKLKIYAAKNSITMGEAIRVLLEKEEKASTK